MFKVRAVLTDGRSVSSQISGTFTEALGSLAAAMKNNGIDPNDSVKSLAVKRIDAGSAFKVSKPRDSKDAKTAKKK